MKMSHLIGMAVLYSAGWANASLTVPGTGNPWLAGMPNGSTGPGGDQAPQQSPILVLSVTIQPGWAYSFSAFDGVGNYRGCPYSGPDGNPSDMAQTMDHSDTPWNGMSSLTAPVNSLIGVFLEPAQPDLTDAPSALDFTTAASRDYAVLMLVLKQPFFIGDGLTSSNVVQKIVAPTGTSRLFLGTMDGYGWCDDGGSFNVTVTAAPNPVPVPGAVLLGTIGLSFARGVSNTNATNPE